MEREMMKFITALEEKRRETRYRSRMMILDFTCVQNIRIF